MTPFARFLFRPALAVVATAITCGLAASQARGEPVVGSQGFLSFAGVTVDGTSNGNINTGTSFVVETLLATQSGSGYFTFSNTSAVQFFSNVTIDTIAPTPGPLFGNADFGTFSLQSLVEEASGSGFRSFLVTGDFVGGTLGGPVDPNPAPAEFRISFTQSGGPGSTISSSATMTFVAVPEPATLTMLGMGGIALAAGFVRRRATAPGLTNGPRRPDSHRGETGRRCR